MATLSEVFGYSMFSQAGLGAQLQNFGARPFPKPDVPPVISDDDAPKQPIWHFEHDMAGDPARVKNLTCIARGMGNGRMTVASAITFESATVRTAAGVDLNLPLTRQFLVRSGYLKTGRLTPGKHLLYPLPVEVDLSLGMCFGYDFPSGGGAPVPIPEAELDKPTFMPDAATTSPPVGAGQVAKHKLAGLRIVVCACLVTAKERKDFEPGEVLGAGRVWPQVMIMANHDLQEARSVVHVERPSSLTMDGGDHSKHADMNSVIEAAFFADNNTAVNIGPGPSPFWDDLFDTADVAVTSGTIRAVDPAEKGGPLSGAIQRLNTDGTTYAPSTITRVKRQGAFDNVHVAPTMRSDATPDEPPDFKLKRIYMAPFCEHDCLHTHWRWAAWNTKPAVLGWSATPKDRFPGEPNQARGAPMVPSNQLVEIESTGPSSFKYRAKAIGARGEADAPIPAGAFSVFFHHGMAYSLILDSALMRLADLLIDTTAVTRGEPDLGGTSASTSNAVRYWRLRFGGDDTFFGPQIVNERLKIVDRAKLLGRAR